MTLAELLEGLSDYSDSHGHCKLVIPIHLEGIVGATPTVRVTNFHFGIDWNHGKLFLEPDKPLTLVDPPQRKRKASPGSGDISE